jgi:hypothetical protein
MDQSWNPPMTKDEAILNLKQDQLGPRPSESSLRTDPHCGVGAWERDGLCEQECYETLHDFPLTGRRIPGNEIKRNDHWCNYGSLGVDVEPYKQLIMEMDSLRKQTKDLLQGIESPIKSLTSRLYTPKGSFPAPPLTLEQRNGVALALWNTLYALHALWDRCTSLVGRSVEIEIQKYPQWNRAFTHMMNTVQSILWYAMQDIYQLMDTLDIQLRYERGVLTNPINHSSPSGAIYYGIGTPISFQRPFHVTPLILVSPKYNSDGVLNVSGGYDVDTSSFTPLVFATAKGVLAPGSQYIALGY